MAVTPVHEFPDTDWSEDAPTRGVESVLEGGAVLSFPQLPFGLSAAEQAFLDPRMSDGKAKNISLRWTGGPSEKATGELRGAAGTEAELRALHAMLERYADNSEAFALRLFPGYRGGLRRGGTSFRPVDVAGRASSWRQDDTRLHIDAFPSNPMHGTRLLRVFSNVNPDGAPRRWRVGEAFEDHAKRYLPEIARPLPGSAWLLATTGITKRRRTEYDHVMLQLHDRAKADAAFQQDSPQARADFAPGTTWVVFSDQVLHAAMGGQHMMEQTFYLDPSAQQQPASSPRDTLERLLGRTLR
ncbi:MAG: Kdo hydroxylase family protein [Pseudomonadota bacterium]|nr:Kdo hydroxylase family protein [Pseudomonadota bacterium]